MLRILTKFILAFAPIVAFAQSIPENAHIDVFGNNWECDRGYRQSGNSCRAMTSNEEAQQHALEQAVIAEMQRRRTQGVSGDDCEWEYDTDSQVCVTATDASLDCQESYYSDGYGSCEVEVDYSVSTDFSGEGYLDVEVECEVEIGYRSPDSYSWRSESESDDEDHSLYSYGSDSDSISLDFSFSSYMTVTKVRIDSVECEIDSVYHY